MKKLLLILAFSFYISIAAIIALAAETRGLQVMAKDPVSGKSGVVKLYEKSYAVIIGIDRYRHLPADRQLQNAVKDARGIEDVLRKHYQFDKIITLFNEQATKDRIMELLTEELPAQMGEQDALFLFWAGHGNQEKSSFGEIGYLIPYDGATDKIRKNLTMAEIRDTISKKIPAKHIFYVMDACYSGLLTTRSVDSKTRRDLNYLKEITRESSRQVLTAGGKGQEALDGGPGGHSVFTGRLIEVLESASDFLTANELQVSIREKVFSDASARNHTQTPGFGALYGMGDFVFVPKQKDTLGDLKAVSAARQQELERLRKAEQEDTEARKLEKDEIAKKEKEIAVLDKEIAEMRTRLGSGTARSGDSLDQIMALAEQKEGQGKRLEALKQQREAEEMQRLQEMEKLKRDEYDKKAGRVEADLAKYQKVASSKYARDMKDSAWVALVANYPEAKKVAVGDVDGFREAVGMAVYIDYRTGLMWAIKDNGTGIDWKSAKSYCENYRGNGYTDWRMPTQEELKELYNKSIEGNNGFHLPSQITLTACCIWASQTRGGAAAGFSFSNGEPYWFPQSSSDSDRALPVRSVK